MRDKESAAIDPFLAFRIGKIVVDAGCKAVLSTWRLFPDLRAAGDRVI